MSLDYKERADAADERRMAYSFFADVFSAEATEDFIGAMAGFQAVEGSMLGEFSSSLKEADIAQVTKEVRSEFCALFLNMCAHPVFTSESVYLSDNHVIMQEQRDQVVDVYRLYKLAVDKGSFDWPEDHISMEMMFMAHLCKIEADLCRCVLDQGSSERESASDRADAVRKAEKAFFADHIDRWVPLFADELSKKAETLFYKGVAEYLEAFVSGEREYLD